MKRTCCVVTTVGALILGGVCLAAAIDDVQLDWTRNMGERGCGFADSGNTVRLINTGSQTVVATVKVTWQTMDGRRSSTDQYRVLAGEEKSIGCTRSSGTEAVEYTYSLTGAHY